MGICLHKIKGDYLVRVDKQLKLENGFIWVVGRRDPNVQVGEKADWHIQGIAISERLALDMCLDRNYFIGPLPINVALPHETVEWVGLYFPLNNT